MTQRRRDDLSAAGMKTESSLGRVDDMRGVKTTPAQIASQVNTAWTWEYSWPHTVCRRFNQCHNRAMNNRLVIALLFAVAAFVRPAQADDDLAARINPDDGPNWRGAALPDWSEPAPAKSAQEFTPVDTARGVVAPAAQQPAGPLSGRIVFMNSGHGWTFETNTATPYWRLQRSVALNSMNEDYGNLDQLNFFAAYCFNAGAVIASMRPLGQQTNEVVLDNDDAGVTFAGSWTDSTSTYYFGSPGDVPYRYSLFAATETATATYTPNIPVAGYYPVYTWVRAGSDRGDQLYRIRHTGGESQIRIPHHMVGNGWIYLGEYYFNAGSNPTNGAVVISNLRGTATGTYTFADAIRFGNGMGSVDQGGGVSGYPHASSPRPSPPSDGGEGEKS